MSEDEYVAIAEKAVSCASGQKVKELAQFLALLSQLKPQVIVEIGVLSGGTLYAWEEVAPIVIGIDEVLEEEITAVADPVIIIGSSHDQSTLEELTRQLAGSPIDCLFIDGDHTYDGVRQDYEMYAHLVRPGGVIAFHDIACHGVAGIEVDRFWSEVRDDTATEIIDPEGGRQWGNNWGGIGVLVKCG